MNVTLTPVTDRMVTIEMTETEARLLQSIAFYSTTIPNSLNFTTAQRSRSIDMLTNLKDALDRSLLVNSTI